MWLIRDGGVEGVVGPTSWGKGFAGLEIAPHPNPLPEGEGR